MEADQQKLLEEIKALARDNNRMLRAVRRDAWFGFISRIIFWAIFLIVPWYVYQQYLAPLVQKFSASPQDAPAGSLGFPTPAELQKFFSASHASGQ